MAQDTVTDEQLHAVLAEHGIDMERLSEFAALDIEDAWRELDERDGTNDAEGQGISGSDIGGYLSELSLDDLHDLIRRRKST